MKTSNTLKITLIISIVILLTLVAFAGIYVKSTNKYLNIIPDYSLGMDLGKKRVVTIKPATGTDTIIYDENGKKVASIPEDADESKYREETKEKNPAEVLTEKNFQNTKNIIEKRLNALKVEGYTIRLDKSTGEIIVELPENDNTQKFADVLTATGRFEMLDEETQEVLLSNKDLKGAKVAYYNGEKGTSVYLTVELTKDGAKKLKDISNTYVDTVEPTTTVDETTGESKTEDKTISKKASLKMDWFSSTGEIAYTTVISQSFSEEMSTGVLQLNIGTAKDNDKIQKYYNQAFQVASALNSGRTEVVYTKTDSKVLESNITNNQIALAGKVLIVIYLAVSIIIIAKYKGLGLFGTISSIGAISLTLFAIRAAKVVCSITTLPAMVVIGLLNIFITIKLIKRIEKSENKKRSLWEAIIEIIELLLIVLAIAIVFMFVANEAIVSTGMILFWGIISIVFTVILFTRPLFLEISK